MLGDNGNQAIELARRVAGYPEPGMRRLVLAEWLGRARPEAAAEWLGEILRLGPEGGPPFSVALAALIALMNDPAPLGYEGLAEIYRAAREQDLTDLAAFFMSSLGGEKGGGIRGVVLEAKGRPLTLGERKSLARRSARDLITRLMGDPDPTVLRQLLLNPRLTEHDVVALAARRPTTAQSQEIIAGARRFAARYAVRRALVMNPYTAADLAVRLAALLRRDDLLLVANEPSVPPQVRDGARRFLAARPHAGRK